MQLQSLRHLAGDDGVQLAGGDVVELEIRRVVALARQEFLHGHVEF